MEIDSISNIHIKEQSYRDAKAKEVYLVRKNELDGIISKVDSQASSNSSIEKYSLRESIARSFAIATRKELRNLTTYTTSDFDPKVKVQNGIRSDLFKDFGQITCALDKPDISHVSHLKNAVSSTSPKYLHQYQRQIDQTLDLLLLNGLYKYNRWSNPTAIEETFENIEHVSRLGLKIDMENISLGFAYQNIEMLIAASLVDYKRNHSQKRQEIPTHVNSSRIFERMIAIETNALLKK